MDDIVIPIKKNHTPGAYIHEQKFYFIFYIGIIPFIKNDILLSRDVYILEDSFSRDFIDHTKQYNNRFKVIEDVHMFSCLATIYSEFENEREFLIWKLKHV